MRYCLPVLPNAGLGNRLFPWARCKVFSRRYGVQMIAPRWSQLKVGPILRGESDWRVYTGLMQATAEELTGPRRQWVLRTVPRTAEVADVDATADLRLPANIVIEFRDMDRFFAPLTGHVGVLREALLDAVRPRWVAAAMGGEVEPIGIHVRRGDFAVPKTEDDLRLRGGVRTPLAWFGNTLQEIRRSAGVDVPAFVVSDGGDDELSELLALPAVRRTGAGSAVADLLLLARATVVIGSGGSSFSAWASFLNESPIVTVPGQSPAWFQLRHANGAYVGEFDPDNPSAEFLAQASERLASANRRSVGPVSATTVGVR